MTVSLYVVPDPEFRATTREALEAILAEDDRLWRHFERVCQVGVLELRESVTGFREVLKERGHGFDTHTEEFKETFIALLSVAEELLPETPGAVRVRLRERVRESVRPRPEGGVKIARPVGVRRAVEVVLAHEHRFFDEVVLTAGCGHTRLYAVAQRIRDGLAAIGHEYPVEEVEDALLVLVREIATNSRAAEPNAERLMKLWRQAQEYVEEHDPDGALGDEVRQEHEVVALHALRDHDLTGYRAALRGLCRAARDAAEGNGGEDEE